MSKRPLFIEFNDKGKGKSFRRPHSPFVSRGVHLSIRRRNAVQNSNSLVQHSQGVRASSSVNNISLDANETVEMVQSLIERGRNLLKSVSAKEKSLQYDVEAELRKESLRLEYIDKSLGNDDSQIFGDLSDAIPAVKGPESVSVSTTKERESSSDDSIIILSDEDESMEETEQYANSFNDNDALGVLSDEPQDEEEDEEEEEEEEEEELFGSEGDEEIGSPSPVSSEHSNRDENQLLSEYSDEEGYINEEDISSEGDQETSKPILYMQQPSQPRLDNNYAMKEKSNENVELSEPDIKSYEEVVDDNVVEMTDNSEEEGIENEEEVANVEEFNAHSDIENSVGKAEHQSDFIYNMNSIAKQALDRMNRHDIEDFETMHIESEDAHSEDAELSHEQKHNSQYNSSDIEEQEQEQYSEDISEQSYSEEDTQNLRSDGVGELGEYSYHINSGNNEYGLITDHDHSIVTGKNEEEQKEVDNLKSAAVLDSSVNIESESETKQSSSNLATVNEEKQDSEVQETVTYAENSPPQKKAKYTLSFSETYSDTDSRISGAEEYRDGSTTEYHSAFSNNPFENSEKVQEEDHILQNILDSLGLSAEGVNGGIQENQCEEDSSVDRNDVSNVISQEFKKALPKNSSFDASNTINETVPIENIEDSSNSKHTSPVMINSEDQEGICSADSDVENESELPSKENSMPEERDVAIKIPLFVDEETIRLTTSPVRKIPTSGSEEIETSIDHNMTDRIKLNRLSVNLECDLLDQRGASLTSVLSNNLQNSMALQSSPETLEPAFGTEVTKEQIGSKPSASQTHNDGISAYDDTKELSNESNPFESSSVKDKSNIKTLPLLHPQATATQSYPFKVLKHSEKRTELSDYVNLIIHGQESNESSVPTPIVTEPLERSISSGGTENSTIQVEEVVTEVPSTDNIQKISTEPEVTLKSSPEIVHDAVIIEEVAFETEITENNTELNSDNQLPDGNVTVQESTHYTSQSVQDITVEATGNNIVNDVWHIDDSNHVSTEIENADVQNIGFRNAKSLSENSIQSSVQNLDEIEVLLSESPELSIHRKENDQANGTEQVAKFDNNIPHNNQNSDITSEITQQHGSTDADSSSGSRKSIAKLIISSPLKILSSLANGLTSVSNAASEFVSTVNSVTLPYDDGSIDASPAENIEYISTVNEEDVQEEDVKEEDVKEEDVQDELADEELVDEENLEEEDIQEELVDEEDIKEEDIKEEDIQEENVEEENVQDELADEELVDEEDIKEEDIQEEDVEEEDVEEEDVQEENVQDELADEELVNKENLEEELVKEENVKGDDKQHLTSKKAEHNDYGSEISDIKGEITEKPQFLEENVKIEQASEGTNMNHDDNHYENNETLAPTKKQASISKPKNNVNNEDNSRDSSNDVFYSADNNEDVELSKIETSTRSDSKSSYNENNDMDSQLKTAKPEDTVTILAEEKPEKVSDIQVTIQEELPKLERTPVKKRPRAVDTERKPSKKKRNKKKKQYRQRNSVMRNLRPRSK
ncbi:silent chromatin protein ESC1 [Kluyveromyces marxianus]|nr:silent chromatin protein ESC1 [Kluyveromyces marxianus]